MSKRNRVPWVKMTLQLVDYEHIPPAEYVSGGHVKPSYGNARVIDGNGLSIPCRVKRDFCGHSAWFDHAGHSWIGRRPSGGKGLLHCRMIKAPKGSSAYAAVNMAPPLDKGLQQLVSRELNTAFQRIFAAMIESGWKISPPDKNNS